MNIIISVILLLLFFALRWAKSNLTKGTGVADSMSWIILVLFAVSLLAFLK